jgi:apolipoprotein N-acyltransferase
VGLFVSSSVYGVVVLAKAPRSDTLRISVIQANIPQDIRWNPRFQKQNLEKHIELTKAAVRTDQPALVVWPETSVRGSVAQNKQLAETFATLAKESAAFLMIGSAERPKFSRGGSQTSNLWNSAFLISPAGNIVGRYNKIRLFPFGEYLPYKELPWPSRIASAWNTPGFEPGSKFTVFEIGGNKLAVTICWENIFPNLVREFVKNGARIIINMTNEAWFGETAAPYQLLSMNVFRAVENRVAVVRAANTGISGFIDPFGRIIGTVQKGHKELFVEGHLTKNVVMSAEQTFYTAYGDVFVLGCIGGFFILISSSFLKLRISATRS